MPNEYLAGEKLRVFVLFSGGASSGVGLVDGDYHKKSYEVVGAGTNNVDASGIKKLLDRDLNVLVSDYSSFCKDESLDPKKQSTNRRYHESWLEKIAQFRPHVIAMSGYFRIVPDIFLQEYPDTKNVHPMALHYLTKKRPRNRQHVAYGGLLDAGDWTPEQASEQISRFDLERAFRGDCAVFDALVFGHDPERDVEVTELRSTVHRAVPEYDNGPIEVESAPVPIDREKVNRLIRRGNWDGIFAYGKELQDELKVRGDVPAFRAAVELTADRRLVHKDGAVFLDGKKLPYKGLQLTE